MKKIALTLTTIGLISSVYASSVINATKITTDLSKITVNSKEWKSAKFTDVILYPQTTIKMNDKNANAKNSDVKAKKAKVAVLVNDKDIAFLVKWADGTKSIQAGHNSSYADGFAIQFPENFSNPKELPYIGMGSEGRNVVIHLQKAVGAFYEPNGNQDVEHQINRDNAPYFEKELQVFDAKVKAIANNDYQKAYIAAGFRSMTEIKDGSSKFFSDMKYGKKKWSGVLTRPLKDDYLDLTKNGSFPVAFAIWDGEKSNRDGLKLLSAWVPIVIDTKNDTLKVVDTLTAPVKGDVKKGQELAMANCAACHAFKGTEGITPSPYMAPNLSNIGGYSTADYLRESIVNPQAALVPGYNRNAHKNFAWYNIDEKGNRISAMPPFNWMQPQEIEDLVMFLQTLKAEVEK